MNLPSSSTKKPNPIPPMNATTPRVCGVRYETATMIAIAIIKAPQIAWEMWRVPFPICGYPVMTRKTRLPTTDATATTRKTSRWRA